jgi:hypothetical protein
MLVLEHSVAPIPGCEICKICKICTCSTNNEDDPEVKTWLIDARSVFRMVFLGEHIIDLQGCRIENLNLILPVRNPRFSILVSIQGFSASPAHESRYLLNVVCVVYAYEVRHAPLRQATFLTRWRLGLLVAVTVLSLPTNPGRRKN